MASAATALLVTPLLTRMLGVAQYDRVAVAIVTLNVAINLLSLGLPTAIIRAVHTDPAGKALARNVVIMGFVVVLLTAGLAAVVIAVLGLGDGIALAVAAGGAGGAVAMVLAFYVATENPRSYVIMSFGLSLGGPVVGLLCTIAFGPQAIHYVAGLAITYLIVAICGALLLPNHGPLSFSIRPFLKALAIGLPMVPHQFAVGAATGASVLLAAFLLPEGAAAGVQLALLIASAPLSIISALSSAWTPVILSAPIESRGARLSETSAVIAALAALGGGALSMLAPWFVQFLAPAEQFDIAAIVPAVAIASVAPVIAVAYTSHLQLVIASGKTLALAILSPIALAVGFVAGWFYVPLVGIPGAGLVFVSVYLCFLLFARALARRVSPIRWLETRVLLALVFAAVASLGGSFLPWDSALWAAIRLTLTALLLAGALAVFIQKSRSVSVA